MEGNGKRSRENRRLIRLRHHRMALILASNKEKRAWQRTRTKKENDAIMSFLVVND